MPNQMSEGSEVVTCRVNGRKEERPVYCVEETGRVVPETKPGEVLYWTWDSAVPQIVQGQTDPTA